MSQQIGASPSTTRTAVQASLPLLISALARNANTSPDAAEAPGRAIDRDHDGSMVDHLSSLIDAVGRKTGTTGGLAFSLGRRTGQYSPGTPRSRFSVCPVPGQTSNNDSAIWLHVLQSAMSIRQMANVELR
jgi:hypothetical protein